MTLRGLPSVSSCTEVSRLYYKTVYQYTHLYTYIFSDSTFIQQF